MKSTTSRPFRLTFLITAILVLLDGIGKIIVLNAPTGTSFQMSLYGFEIIIGGGMLLAYMMFVLIYEKGLKKERIKNLDKYVYIALILMMMLDIAFRIDFYDEPILTSYTYLHIYMWVHVSIGEVMIIMLSILFLLYNLYRSNIISKSSKKENKLFKYFLLPLGITLVSWFLTWGITLIRNWDRKKSVVDTFGFTYWDALQGDVIIFASLFIFVFSALQFYYISKANNKNDTEEIEIKKEKYNKIIFLSVLLVLWIFVIIKVKLFASKLSGKTLSEVFFKNVLRTSTYNKDYLISIFRTELFILLAITVVFIALLIIKKVSKRKIKFYGPLYVVLIISLIFDFIQKMIIEEITSVGGLFYILHYLKIVPDNPAYREIKVDYIIHIPELIIIVVSVIAMILVKNILSKKNKLEVATNISKDLMLSSLILFSSFAIFVCMHISIKSVYIKDALIVASIMQGVVILLFIIMKIISKFKHPDNEEVEV